MPILYHKTAHCFHPAPGPSRGTHWTSSSPNQVVTSHKSNGNISCPSLPGHGLCSPTDQGFPVSLSLHPCCEDSLQVLEVYLGSKCWRWGGFADEWRSLTQFILPQENPGLWEWDLVEIFPLEVHHFLLTITGEYGWGFSKRVVILGWLWGSCLNQSMFPSNKG